MALNTNRSPGDPIKSSDINNIASTINNVSSQASRAVSTAEAAYAYNQALVAPAADVVNAVVTDPATPAGSLVDSIARRSGRTIYADLWYDETATDHRPALQAALDTAQAGDTVILGSGRTWIMGSKTRPWADEATAAFEDRVLVKPPGVSIVGQPGATIKIADNFGRYGALIGTQRDNKYETGCTVAGFTIDWNARGGNTITDATRKQYPAVGLRLVSYGAGSSITMRDMVFYDADSTWCAYLGAHHITVSGNACRDTGKNASEWHDHSSVYTVTTVAGGAQQWGPNTWHGAGRGANCPIEIHGGTVSLAPQTIAGYYVAANLCGAPNAPLTLSGAVTATGVAYGITLWASEAVGEIRSVDIDINVQLSRDEWDALGVWPNATKPAALDLWAGCTKPIQALRVRGIARYLPSALTGISSDYRSCGVRLAASDTTMTISEVDIDLRVVEPYSAGVLVSCNLRRGRIRLDVTNPATTKSTLPDPYRTGAALASCELHGIDLDLTVRDTRPTPEVKSVVYAGGGTNGIRACTDSTARLRVFTEPGTTAPIPWVPAASVLGLDGMRVTQESNSAFTTIYGNLRGGSEHLNQVTGKRMRQTTYPAGTTWTEVTA